MVTIQLGRLPVMPAEAGIQLDARAKINLLLRVGRRRNDGYHEVFTLLQSVSLADRIRIHCRPAARGGTLKLTLSDQKIPSDQSNTVCKAHRYLCEKYPEARKFDFTVHVEKRIPAGAGLGGGSADAAGFLIGACKLLGLKIPAGRAALIEVATKIGADAAFCLRGGTAVGRGRGELITPVAHLPNARVLIVTPKIHISTVEAYRDLDRARRGLKNLTNAAFPRSLYEVVARAVRKRQSVQITTNDFQSQACSTFPKLARVADGLARFGFSAMSGTGSAFFLIPRRGIALRHVRAVVPRDCEIFECRVTRNGVRGLGVHGGFGSPNQKNGPGV